MAIGHYCNNCKHKELEHKFDKWPCMDCCDGDRCDPPTNADRIRAMTDEELAEYLTDVSRDDMISCIQEWFAQECTLKGVATL